jgi:hypothetical protein
MAEREYIVRLPGGYFDERGQLHDSAVLAPLAGCDEEALLADGASPAAAVTRVLARTIRRIGSIDRINDELVRRLLVADRQVLLLELRARTFGARVSGSCCCERPGCGQRISLSFALRDLPVRALADKRPAYRVALPDDGGGGSGRLVMVRLPSGGDQEAVCDAVAAGVSGAGALRLLVGRCLVDDPDGAGTAGELAPADLLAIERFLADTAPMVDLGVCVRCPECRSEITVELELQDFFFGELALSAEQLYRDIHHLALHYHWSEQDILTMPRPKRERYLGLIAEAMEAANAGA